MSRIRLEDALAAVKAVRRDQDVVVNTMAAAKVWMDLGPLHPRDVIFVPSAMGHATSMGLGIAMAQPARRVIVCNGDGSMLMNLGSLVTIATVAPKNLVVIVMDNGVYEVTGAEPTPGSEAGRRGRSGVDFVGFAKSAGFELVHHFTTAEQWTQAAASVLSAHGPVFVLLDTEAVAGRPGPKSPGPAATRARALIEALRT